MEIRLHPLQVTTYPGLSLSSAPFHYRHLSNKTTKIVTNKMNKLEGLYVQHCTVQISNTETKLNINSCTQMEENKVRYLVITQTKL